jgi:hypothetical protein
MEPTYIDNSTGLEWLYCEDGGKLPWDRVLSYPGAELEDDSWRVPTFLEVSSLFNFSKRVELKENLPPIIFWLDHEFDSNKAWTVSFEEIRFFRSTKSNPRDLFFVRDIV